jgi:tocopherol cyclase
MSRQKTHFISNTLHPELYHGDVLHPPFFEGWYFKVVDSRGLHRFAFIPGVFIGQSGEDSHAFVQVLDGSTGQVEYHRYPIEAFHAASDAFDLQIGKNRFSLDRIELNIHKSSQAIKGELSFDAPISWPVRLVFPGVMGWFAWVPRMECYHGVLGFDHAVHGSIEVDDKVFDFTDGRGYIEKDWGHAFPQAWIWMQTNHFAQSRLSLTASVAIIPWMGSAFAGFIVGFWQDGRLHRFATYASSRILELEVDDQHVRWKMRNRRHRLEILAVRSEGSLLRAPTPKGMGRRIAETLSAMIKVRLVHLKTGEVEFEGTGNFAGLEAVGDMDRLQQMVQKHQSDVLNVL